MKKLLTPVIDGRMTDMYAKRVMFDIFFELCYHKDSFLNISVCAALYRKLISSSGQ